MKARTMFCVAVFIIAGFGLLIYQLYALQLRDAELYRTEAVTQQMKDITLPALRGSIYSANGKLLARATRYGTLLPIRPPLQRAVPRRHSCVPPHRGLRSCSAMAPRRTPCMRS